MSKNPKTDLQKDIEKKMRKIISDYQDNNIDLKQLCDEMFIAVSKKYMRDCYPVPVFFYDDWVPYQIAKGNYEIVADVASGRTFQDSFTEQENEQAKEMIVSYDNVTIANTKFLEWLLNRNILLHYLGVGVSYIEINTIANRNKNALHQGKELDITQEGKELDITQVMIKIKTKSMSKKGKGELAEIRFNVDEEGKYSFHEILMMHMAHGSYVEKDMEESNKVDLVNFMQKFIENMKMLEKRSADFEK